MNQEYINNFIKNNKDSIRSLNCFIFSLQKVTIKWKAQLGGSGKFVNTINKTLFLEPEGFTILNNILLKFYTKNDKKNLKKFIEFRGNSKSGRRSKF